MSLRALTLLAAISAAVLSPAVAFAADAVAVRQIARAEPRTCLRWVWQQYSWYDDCWATRHPYIAGRGAIRR
jgi:hypothetical protein